MSIRTSPDPVSPPSRVVTGARRWVTSTVIVLLEVAHYVLLRDSGWANEVEILQTAAFASLGIQLIVSGLLRLSQDLKPHVDPEGNIKIARPGATASRFLADAKKWITPSMVVILEVASRISAPGSSWAHGAETVQAVAIASLGLQLLVLGYLRIRPRVRLHVDRDGNVRVWKRLDGRGPETP
ncbi:hypothetical protein [Streptomyces aureus]|uniref:hypothetical protein n=1 Tax=Streptomyces aureus TaxID=193461 RepID=UPI0036A9CB2A